MTQTADNPFLISGRPVEFGANRSLSLSDTQDAWLIESGTIDIFVSAPAGDEPVDDHIHLAHFEAGQILFGVGPHACTCGLRFVAIGSAEAVLRQAPLSCLRVSEEATTDRTALCRCIEQWVSAWYPALLTNGPPSHCTILPTGKEIDLAEGACAKTPAERLVWSRTVYGSALLAGQEEIRLSEGSAFFPLGPSAWIQTRNETRLRCEETATLLEKDEVWAALEHFHQTSSAWLLRRLSKSKVDEGERLVMKTTFRRETVATALSQLASILTAPATEKRVHQSDGDSLFAASQLVGNAQGISFVQPPTLPADGRGRESVSKICCASHVRSRRVVLAGQWWDRDCGPLLGFMQEGDRPVGLLPVAGGYEIARPTHSNRLRVTAETASVLKSLAHSFYRPLPERSLKIWDLIRFGLYGLKSDIILILCLGVATGLVSLLIPIGTGIIFDSIIPGAETRQLVQITVGLLSAACAIALFDLTRSVAVFRIETKGEASLQAAVWDRLLRLPVPFFKDFSTGDLANRANGIGAIRQILSGAVLSSLLAGIFSVFNLLLLFYYSSQLALIAVGLVFLALVATLVTTWSTLNRQRLLYQMQGSISGLVLQLIAGISKLRVAGAERQAFAVWADRFSRQGDLELQVRRVSSRLDVFNSIFPVLCSILLFTGMVFWVQGEVSTGHFLAFSAAFGGFMAGMLGMSSASMSILEILPISERCKPILKAVPEVCRGASDPGQLSGEIEVNHVSFRYDPEGPAILHDISFKARAGEFVAIVGPSGSGKSTLLRLLLGFETPASGAIYFDGHDLAGLDITAVRRQLGVVLQSSKVIPGTIFENILGSSSFSLDDAWTAARKAGLAEDIESMPMGMHTFLGEGTSTLSGGQRQRLLIARAIVSQPRIILFDEATSALDNRTQATVSASLDQLRATRIVIAHRLSTIVNADRILVMRTGRIVQSGSYAQLLEESGPFAELAQRQLI